MPSPAAFSTAFQLCRPVLGMAFLLLTGCLPGEEYTRRVEKSFPLEAGGALEVDSRSADIQVRVGSGPGVACVVIMKTKAESAPEADARFDEVETVFEPSGNRLKVRLDYPPETNGSNVIFRHRGLDLLLEVAVPESFTLDLHSTSGDLQTTGVKGDHRLRTTSGDIATASCPGNLEIRSTSGDLRVERSPGTHRLDTTSGDIEVRESDGALSLESTSGDIRVRDGAGDVQAQTTSGDIRFDQVAGSHRVRSVSGDVRAEVPGALAAESTWKTVSGDLQVSLDPAVRANVEIHTVSGDLDLSLPIDPPPAPGKRPLRKVEGKINGGGPRLFLETVSGSLSLRTRPAVEAI